MYAINIVDGEITNIHSKGIPTHEDYSYFEEDLIAAINLSLDTRAKMVTREMNIEIDALQAQIKKLKETVCYKSS